MQPADFPRITSGLRSWRIGPRQPSHRSVA